MTKKTKDTLIKILQASFNSNMQELCHLKHQFSLRPDYRLPMDTDDFDYELEIEKLEETRQEMNDLLSDVMFTPVTDQKQEDQEDEG